MQVWDAEIAESCSRVKMVFLSHQGTSRGIYVRFGSIADINRYSITSSAHASTDSGKVRPSAFAAVRLIVNSNVTGWAKADMCGAPAHVRSTSESGHRRFNRKSAKSQKKRTFVVRLAIFIPSDADFDDRRDD